jgi:hypothetical protein
LRDHPARAIPFDLGLALRGAARAGLSFDDQFPVSAQVGISQVGISKSSISDGARNEYASIADFVGDADDMRLGDKRSEARGISVSRFIE